MNTEQVLIHGTLKPDGTLILDQPPPLAAGPVEVLIRALPQSTATGETWWEFLQRGRAELLARGHTFRTPEQIDAERARVQSADEERRRAIRQTQAAQE